MAQKIHRVFARVPGMPESITILVEARWSWNKPYYSVDGGRSWHRKIRKAVEMSYRCDVRFS